MHVWGHIGYEMAMCAQSLERQFYPGVHEIKHGLQVKRGDSPPILHSRKTTPRVLWSTLEHPAQ